MPARKLNLLEGRLLANLFFEPSTRTSSSFATAMLRMGGDYLNLNTATSSSQKGETLADTVRVMSQYADVLAIRHPSDSVYTDLAEEVDLSIPILNAGNGASEHPTQALLDLLCIQTELGASSLDGLQVSLRHPHPHTTAARTHHRRRAS
jgi:aspartate carbamoyltransferase catalytic subunit